MNTFKELLERFVKEFIARTRRYPAGQELQDIAKQAQEAFDKQKTFTVVDQRKLPRAEIEALPLKDKEKAEAAVKKKLEAQNIQAQQSLKGGESSGGQRGRPEVVDENYDQTVFIDKSEMMMIMDDAAKKFDQARDAVARGDYDEARAILRFEIEDNYKLPQETRNAAYDARVFIRRGEGIDPKEMGYENIDEAIEALDEQITKGMKTTMEDNWPMYTNPDDKSKMKNIEYVNFLDEPGEDFGTPNSIMKTPSDIEYEYADGGRVGFARGSGIITILNQLLKSKKMGAEEVAQLIDLVNQAKKAGIPINTLKDLENFKNQIEEAGGKIYESRKKYPGVPEGTKSGLPIEKNWIEKEREYLDSQLEQLKTPMLIKDRLDDLKILNKVEELGGDKAMYDDLRMRKFKGLPSKADYRANPEKAELEQSKKMKKTEKEIDQLLGTDKPDDDVGMFDDIFNTMFKDYKEGNIPDYIPGEEPLTPTSKKKRRLNAEGGLNYLLGF